MKTILLLVLLLVIASCNISKKNTGRTLEEEEASKEFIMSFFDGVELMKYVYIDKTGCVHSTRECEILDTSYQIKFVDTFSICNVEYFCSHCIGNKRFEHLISIINRNDTTQRALYVRKKELSIHR